jgi:hypothetical protein
MRRRSLLAALAAASGAFPPARPANAHRPEVSAPGGIAIGGADCVAYFTEGRHRPGLPDLVVRWRGALWLFSRPETLAAFEMNPRAYCPQFGGHCTLSMAHGSVAAGDPEAFLVHADALYLFLNAEALARARGDIDATLTLARANWAALLDD